MRKYYIDNRDAILKQRHQHYVLNRERLIKEKRDDRKRIRIKLFEVLGGAVCIRCGFSDTRALQFDHINGGGTKIYKIQSNIKMYKNYTKNLELAKKDLQVLCANCNWIKRYEMNEIKTC